MNENGKIPSWEIFSFLFNSKIVRLPLSLTRPFIYMYVLNYKDSCIIHVSVRKPRSNNFSLLRFELWTPKSIHWHFEQNTGDKLQTCYKNFKAIILNWNFYNETIASQRIYFQSPSTEKIYICIMLILAYQSS